MEWKVRCKCKHFDVYVSVCLWYESSGRHTPLLPQSNINSGALGRARGLTKKSMVKIWTRISGKQLLLKRHFKKKKRQIVLVLREKKWWKSTMIAAMKKCFLNFRNTVAEPVGSKLSVLRYGQLYQFRHNLVVDSPLFIQQRSAFVLTKTLTKTIFVGTEKERDKDREDTKGRESEKEDLNFHSTNNRRNEPSKQAWKMSLKKAISRKWAQKTRRTYGDLVMENNLRFLCLWKCHRLFGM